MNTKDSVEVEIGALREHGATGTLELRTKDGKWVYPLRLQRATAEALAREFEGESAGGGSVRDILAGTILNLGAKLKSVRISAAPRGRITAEVVFDHDGKETAMPSRPADAVALARRLKAPVYVGRDVLERDAVRVDEGAEDVAKAGVNDMARMVWGFRAMGRTDEAILAARRFLELAPENESWGEALGMLYGEKGWLKRAAQEYARGMMWYMRNGYITHAVNVAREIGALDLAGLGPRTLAAPVTLEDFESLEYNNEWLAGGDVIDAPEKAGGKAYRDSFNLPEDSRPWFILALLGTQVWRNAGRLVVDAYLKLTAGKPGRHVLGCSLDLRGFGDKEWVTGPQVEIKPGWNRCVFPLKEKVWTQGENKLGLTGDSIGPVFNITLIPEGLDVAAVGEICYSKIRLE